MAQHGPVVLTKDGQPCATLEDVSGSDWESTSLAHNPEFTALIERSRRSYREQG
jgi:hypothetical protein